MPDRVPPIVVPAVEPTADAAHGGAVIFIHGLGDDGAGFEDLARQVQGAKRLPHVKWIFPTALENRDMMQNAWYEITGLKPIPPGRPELEEDEDEDGILFSMKYIVSLIDEQVLNGIPADRIVVGGFSQGCALSLVTGLLSKYSGQLAGVMGLAGYIPLSKRMGELRKEHETSEIHRMPTFLARGDRDMLIPSQFRAGPKLEQLGFGEDQVEDHVYPNLGHTISGPVINDMCNWLEKALPQKVV